MRLQEGRLIKNSADALNLLQNGKLAGMLGGKKFIPGWVLEDGGTELFNTLVEETLNVLGTDPNIAGDQVICFLIKASKSGSEKWEKVITENPDTLIALSKAFAAQWFKAPEWQERVQILIDDPAYDTNLWHDLEKDILEALDKRAAKKGKKITNTASLYETLYDDGRWKLLVPTCFEGDVELASHMRPFASSEGKLLTKTQWCTAAQKMYYDRYTGNGSHKLFVIQKWVKGEYTEAWQLSFMEEHIEFMNKTDHPGYAAVRKAPEELLKKIVFDNRGSIYYNKLTLFDIFANFNKIDDIFYEREKTEFVRNNSSVEGDFHFMDIGGEKVLVGFAGTFDETKTELIIPKGVKTLRIGNDDIWVNKGSLKKGNIETVIVPEGVEVLDIYCFSGFTKLKNLTLPSTLKEIRERAFCGGELEEIVIPEGVVKMGRSPVIVDCDKLKRVVLPSTLKEIEKGIINSCNALETIEYPGEVDWLEKLQSYLSPSCPLIKNLKFELGIIEKNAYIEGEFETFEIPSNCTKIERNAFKYCKNLKEITIPAAVKTIEPEAFKACSSLERITFETSCKIRLIPEDFACECPNLKEVILPDGLTEIDRDAFTNTGLESITIPASVKILGMRCFKDCKNLQEVIIPANSQLTWISRGVFDGCRNLKEITLPKKLSDLGQEAFQLTNLEEIIIPRRVSEIQDSCFYGCENLRRVTITDNVSWIRSHAFDNCKNFEKLKILVQPDLLEDFDPYVDIHWHINSFQNNPYAKVLEKHGVKFYDSYI